MSLFNELKRRNVFRVGLFYVVSSWVIVQVAETLLPVFDVPDTAIRATVMILALGFPIALVFSWIFEFTPDGLKRDSEVRAAPEAERQTSNKLNRATLVVAILAIGLVIADRFSSSVPTPAPSESIASEPVEASDSINPASIAVLPFEDLSPLNEALLRVGLVSRRVENRDELLRDDIEGSSDQRST